MKYIIAVMVSVLIISCGKTHVKKGDRVTLAYKITDTLNITIDKTILDSRFDHLDSKELFAFEVGNNEVIQGWDSVLIGCKKNRVYKFKIPYQKAYGDAKIYNDLLPKSDLIVEFKIVKIE